MIKELFAIFTDSLNSFEGQKEGEEVLQLLRHHPFNIFLTLGSFALGAFIPFLAGIIFWSRISEYGFGQIFLFALSLWFLTLWLGAFHALAMYSLNTLIITNERLIENEQLGIFNRKVSELDNDRIQDVSAHTNGFIETLLDFGTVTVQTAGSDKHFVFRTVPNPEKVKDIIMRMAGDKHQGLKMPSI
jgi:uncharacterized membrane protein YdbT with pleckstrin-like domain